MKVDFRGEYFDPTCNEYVKFDQSYDVIDLPCIDYHAFLKLVRHSFGKRDTERNSLIVSAHKDRYIVVFNFYDDYLVVMKNDGGVEYQCEKIKWCDLVYKVISFHNNIGDDFGE